MSFIERIQNGWNAFMSRAPTNDYNTGIGSYYRPDPGTFSR